MLFLNSSKGFNQIDFAIGISLTILMMSITISYLTSTIVTPISTYSTSELRSKAENFNNIMFKTKGIPENWHQLNRSVRPGLGTTLFKRKIYLDEYNGSNNIDKNVKVHLDLNESAYEESIVVYESNRSLKTDLVSPMDSDSDGLLEETDVVFNVNVSPNSEKTLTVYYSKDKNTSYSYANLSPDNTTLNKTVFTERDIKSISRQKMDKLQGMSYEEVKDKFAMRRNFHLWIENQTSKLWEYGMKNSQGNYYELPKGEDVVLSTDKILYQRDDGKVKFIRTAVAVW